MPRSFALYVMFACLGAGFLGGFVTGQARPSCAVTMAEARTIQAKASQIALDLQARMAEALRP
jgi:hypothetical protein